MEKLRNAITVVVFISILVLLLVVLSKSFVALEVSGIKSEKKDTIDYLVLGDSEAYTSISPMEIWKKSGLKGYNLGVSSQTLQKGSTVYRKALENQQPKVLLIETNFIFRNTGMINELEYFLTNTLSDSFAIFENHSNWKTFAKEKQWPSFRQPIMLPNPLKGYYFNVDQNPYVKGDYVKPTNVRAVIQQPQREILDNILELSRERDIQVIFYSSPSPVNWTYAQHNVISDIATKNGLQYLDLNLLSSDLNIDWSKDTYDAGDHLNFFGAKKVSEFISESLENNSALKSNGMDIDRDLWMSEMKTYDEIVVAMKNRYR
ncbi:hypothetical protein [Erysipelothrix aquatica]|uniref:hypothetical protein n=1 Tax=Erysipelothrix aquatica TaxID=2683714 RepID=UPI00135BE1A2|nr:hypothetical protein [Erysipelothrix aquatica]